MNTATNKQMDWQTMPNSTRVWIYQANRALGSDEVLTIEKAGQAFVDDWSSHGAEMSAVMEVFHERFLVLFADEAQAKASGCGIDKSVRFVQEIEQHFGVDFFDRMTVCYLQEDEIKDCKLAEVPSLLESGELSKDTFFFDNLVSNKEAFQNRWKVKMSEGWTSRYFK